MKTIIKFFVMIYNWFISLFKRKVKETHKEQKGDSYGQVQYSNNPVIPSHNNRKTTRGRFVQYINVGENRQRAIYQ